MRGKRCRLIPLLALVVALLVPAGARAALTITVDTTQDPGPPGTTSLRQALAAAADGDTVHVPASAQHYVLAPANGVLSVGSAITVRGDGPGNTIVDGQGQVQVFDVTGAATLTGLTITGGKVTSGNGGGGVAVEHDNVTLDHVAVTENEAFLNVATGFVGGGGIYAHADNVAISDSTISNNTLVTDWTGSGGFFGGGGGIFFLGSGMNVVRSTIAGNSSTHINAGNSFNGGGGIFQQGQNVTVTNSTIRGNSTTYNGTNTSFRGGGGIFHEGVNLTLLNDTLDANSANNQGGDLFASDASDVVVKNTIFARGVAPSGPNCSIGSGAPTTSHNLEDADTCQLQTANGDQKGVSPQLGPLTGNGGPTATEALGASSPAIDRGDDAGCPATDQRGVSRPQGSHCDIGAFEVAVPIPVAVPPAASLPTLPAFSGVRLTRRTFIVSGRTVTVPVFCPVGPCSGQITFRTAARFTPPKRVSASARKAKKRITLGSAKFTIASGETRNVKVRLTRAGLKLLAKKRRLKVLAAERTTSGGATVSTRQTVTFKLKKTRKR